MLQTNYVHEWHEVSLESKVQYTLSPYHTLDNSDWPAISPKAILDVAIMMGQSISGLLF